MKSNFNDCLNRVLKDEGGYSNVKGDNGGPTNFGITLADYRKYIKSTGTATNVKNMSVDEAKVIYRARYWNAINGDTLPSGVDYTCFDYAVNSGLQRPQRALKKFSKLSGVKLIDAINDERTTFLKGLAATQVHDQPFLKGWLSRVSRVRAYSKVLASKADNTTGPIVATGTGGFFYGLSQFWHNHEVAIIIGGLITAIVIGAAVHLYRNK